MCICICSERPKCPWLTTPFRLCVFCLLVDVHPQDSSTGQGHLGAIFGNENRYVNVSFNRVKSVQMTLTDSSVHFVFFSPIGAGYPQHSPTREGNLESSWGIDHRYVNAWFYLFKTAQMTLTDSSFYFAFFAPIGGCAPSGLSNRARALGSDIWSRL